MANFAIYKRTLDGFIPASDDAALFFGKTKLGQLVTLDGKQARNLKFHRLFFAILRLISANSNPHVSENILLHRAKGFAGIGEVYYTKTGEPRFAPGSISFGSMDEDAFQAFVQLAIPPLVADYMAGTAPEAVIREAMELAA